MRNVKVNLKWILTRSRIHVSSEEKETLRCCERRQNSVDHREPLHNHRMYKRYSIFSNSISDENDIPLVPLNATQSIANNLHQSHQHLFQHQSSVSSIASVQTVLYQAPPNGCGSYSGSSVTSMTNPMLLLGNSSSSTSFQSANGSGLGFNGSNGQPSVGSGSGTGFHYPSNNRLNQSGSISSLGSNGNNGVMLQHQPISNSSNVSIGEEAMNIGDVADLLHPQYAIITGGRSREGCPIITFPDHNNFHMLTERDYEKLISYLTAVPPWVRPFRLLTTVCFEIIWFFLANFQFARGRFRIQSNYWSTQGPLDSGQSCASENLGKSTWTQRPVNLNF